MKNYIESGKAILGIEFGSTRIKAVLINDEGDVLAVGGTFSASRREKRGVAVPAGFPAGYRGSNSERRAA